MSDSSYRASLRSSAVIGGAQMINIFASLVKMKFAAVVLGPAGVGLIGLYSNLVSTAASIWSLGVGTTGVRQIVIATSEDSDAKLSLTRRSLFWGSFALAITGAAIMWIAKGWIARVLLSDESRSGDVAFLSVGVALSVAVTAQTALLTGLRRVGDLARVNIGAGVAGAAIGILAMWLWPTQSVLVLVLVSPVLSYLFGRLFVARLGRSAGPRQAPSAIARECWAMARPGIGFMVSGLIALLSQLVVRTLIQRELGAEAQGQFQAAWTISMTYLGFVLGAMGTDFLPRLTVAITDRSSASKLINEQTEMALLLCAPVVTGMLAFAPWVIRLLYSPEFGPAVDILRWQLLGDILKVMVWPIGFVQAASGAARTFFMTETFGAVLLVLGVYVGLPRIGIAATGVSFFMVYLAYLPLMWWLGRVWIGFHWTRSVWGQAIAIFGIAVLVDITSRQSEVAGLIAGGLITVAVALWSIVRLSTLSGQEGKLGRIGVLAEKITGLVAWIAKFK